MNPKPQKIGLVVATSLVIGNMIGSGIFVLPAALAAYGGISLLGWIFSATGALILAKIFSNFSRIIVNKSGGPYAYSKAGFGDFIGFLVAWGYWVSIWITNGAIAIAIVSALAYFFPVLNVNPIASVSLGLGFIWLLTWVNSRGIKESGKIQVITVVLKILPLLFVIIVGSFFFDLNKFPTFNTSETSDFSALSIVASLTFFAFLGLESATVPADNIKNPEITVPRATMLGTVITTMIYIISTVILFGILPTDQLVNSTAPFADAARIIGGDFAGAFVASGVAIAAIGALNGWILMVGQIPMATAKDNLFPRIFKKENKNNVPIIGLIIGSLLSSLVLLMNYTGGLVEQFEFMVLLGTLTVLVPYIFTAAAYALVIIDKKLGAKNRLKNIVLASLGFAFSFWAIYGTGHDTVFYGFLLLIFGIPFYIMMKWNQYK